MKICIINDDLKIGGKEKVIIIKANEFVKNHDVSIILLGSDNSLEYNLDKRINLVYLNTKLDYNLNFPKLLSLFFPFPKKYKLSTYDRVYCHYSFKGWQLLNMLNAINKIVVIHGDILKTVKLPILKKNIYEFVIKFLLKKYKISFVSEDLKNKFEKRRIVKSICSYYIPNPFEFDVVNRVISSNKLNFINIANLIPLKNQKRLIYAFSKLIKQYENIQLFILGDGVLLEELKILTVIYLMLILVYYLLFGKDYQ
jgi:glycosyltransferase involved in cell wall biosynthesis